MRRANDELEARVTARTVELEKTNQALQAEITGRKRIEEQLRMQKTELRVLFDWACRNAS